MMLLLFLFVGLVAGIGLALRPRFNNPVRSDRYTPRPRGTLTFNKDVAPIIFDRCAYCHRPGQTAPFTLLNYADVKKRSKQIAEVTARGYMPPWLPEPGFGDFTDVRRLAANQLGVLQQWIAEGAVEGDPSGLPPTPKWPEDWQLGVPDLVVKMPQAYALASEGKDVYRNVVIPIPVGTSRYVKGGAFARQPQSAASRVYQPRRDQAIAATGGSSKSAGLRRHGFA